MNLKIISPKDERDSEMSVEPVSINEGHYDEDNPNPFPYVVERLMAGVYLRREVFFREKPPTESRGRPFYIKEPDAFKDGKLSPAAREKLIDVVCRAAGKVNRRLCAVFSPEEAVYCEPDGTFEESKVIPSGGVLFSGSSD
jgi:hypothetical protein